MAEPLRRQPRLFLLFILSLLSVCKCDDELQVLLKLKLSLENSRTDVFTSWTETNSKCNFTGVVCNSNGLVAEINLPNKQLVGTLPFDSLCTLEWLERLDLGTNFLQGSITPHLGSCTKLKYLDLGNNSFVGNVPDLSTLNKLELLDLNNSGFSGMFPWKSLENMTSLAFLSLGDNIFDLSPFPLEVLKLSNLYWLYLSNCSITGQIPDGIGNLTLLQNLELSDNRLSGKFPEGIGRLNKLWQLELYNNSLTGKFPFGFRNLTNLVNLDTSHNQLEGDLTEIKYLTRLSSLQLFENQLSGEIPEEIGEFSYLKDLSLYTNKFTGSIPQKLGSLGAFNVIDVSENLLTGNIPPDMCKNGALTDLLMLQNKLSGSIPETYANCPTLNRLRLSHNLLSGNVPAGIWGLPNLEILDLARNQLEGPITSEIGKGKSLALLFLAQNQFGGAFPVAISEASSLVTVQLSSNKLTGEIPSTIGNLKKLGDLYLDGNMLSGSIPESISSCVSLTVINLSNNNLSGEIPASIGNLPTLNSLNLSNNNLSGGIPTSLSSPKLSQLDLSNNHLTGSIPESLYIGSFGGNPGLCSQRFHEFPPCMSVSSGSSHQLRTILSCFIAGITLVVVSFGCFVYVKLRRTHSITCPLKTDSWNMKSYHVLSFTEREIADAIKKENLIGRGGSGNVYKVVLRNGKELAVKHIWRSHDGNGRSCKSSSAMLEKSNTRSREYNAEVAALSSIRHVNVVKLYCSITSEDSNLLVYEYLPNGSLWDKLHTCQKTVMTWDVRYEIALGAARGLEYLHHGCDRPVIHRDVKSSNILLDEEWKPRIADFGLAKMVQPAGGGQWTHNIAGTYGYIAPEYAYTCKINEKSDVYSFGVVLLELVTGKRPIEQEFGNNKDIVCWVLNNMKSQESLLALVDPNISDNLKEDAVKVLRIAILCTAKIPASRPSIRIVVQMLEEAEPCRLTSISVEKVGENSQQPASSSKFKPTTELPPLFFP